MVSSGCESALAKIAPPLAMEWDNPIFANLAATLTVIRKLKGVNGYILRSNTAAIVDIPRRELIAEYAMLSAEIFDSAKEVTRQFGLADVESVVVDGRNVKVLCIELAGNRVAVFMDKTCAHTWIVKRILL